MIQCINDVRDQIVINFRRIRVFLIQFKLRDVDPVFLDRMTKIFLQADLPGAPCEIDGVCAVNLIAEEDVVFDEHRHDVIHVIFQFFV